MGRGFSVSIVESLDDALALAPAWSELADAVRARPFARPAWCLSWWRHLGRGDLAIAMVERDGELVALAPLHERARTGLRIVRFLGHGLGTIGEILVAPGQEDAVEALWSEVLKDRRRVLHLLEVADDGSTRTAIEALAGAATSVVPRDECPTIELGGTYEAYLATRSKGLRKQLRRSDNRLTEDGTSFELEEARDRSGLERVLPDVLTVYDSAERHQPRQHLLDGRVGGLTREYLRTSAEDGTLRLYVGRIDGRPVSFDVAFRSWDRLHLWAGRFDPDYASISPGHLALARIVRRACDEEVEEIDLLLGAHDYKLRWASNRYRTLKVVAAPSPLLLRSGQAVLGVSEVARDLLRARR